MSKPELTNQDIVKLADLAKIEINESEAESFKNDINSILGHLSLVNDAQVSGESGEDTELFYNYTREDILPVDQDERGFQRQIIFDNIPSKSKDNQVKVSKVIKK